MRSSMGGSEFIFVRAFLLVLRATDFPGRATRGAPLFGAGTKPVRFGRTSRRPKPRTRTLFSSPRTRFIILRVASTPRAADSRVSPLRLAASLMRSDFVIDSDPDRAVFYKRVRRIPTAPPVPVRY